MIALDRAVMPPPSTSAPTRVVRYGYDALLRLTSATETPGSSFAYDYDLGGNRISVTLNGQTTTSSYDAADQIVGASYDAAGNLLNDGAASYSYDALNRLLNVTSATQGLGYSYNGDGALVAQADGQNTTVYAQDLAAPLPQVVQSQAGRGRPVTSYLYGTERLAALNGTAKSWYVGDGLGSVRRTLTDAGVAGASINYDPWGAVESGAVPTFGFTGKVAAQTRKRRHQQVGQSPEQGHEFFAAVAFACMQPDAVRFQPIFCILLIAGGGYPKAAIYDTVDVKAELAIGFSPLQSGIGWQHFTAFQGEWIFS